MRLNILASLLTVALSVNAVSIPTAERSEKDQEDEKDGEKPTATQSVDSYGDFPKIPIPTLPSSPFQTANASLSTSDDARRNPFALNSPQHRGNWLPGFDINTDYTQRWPTTFRTVRQTFTITNTTGAPDGGASQIMLLVNGQYPGPLLEANWGDYIEITVINKLQNNGTGIHWHGFRQLNTNDADGPSGVTECPIAPGSQKVYRFQATHYGSSWYHSHFSAQYGNGVLGPILVHGPSSSNWDIDLGNVLVNEWYPLTTYQEDWFAHRIGPVPASNFLINGKNIKPDGSSGQRTQFQFTPGKKHLLRFVNTASDHHFKIQIDGHNMTVIANDHVPITPYVTKEISIGLGQRYDVVVTANQAVSNYYLRTFPASGCALNANDGTGNANAIISYAGARSTLPAVNRTVAALSPACVDEPLASLVPIVPQSVDSTTFKAQFSTLPVNVKRVSVASGDNFFLWYLNGVSLNIDWANPSIEAVSLNRTIASSSNSSQYLPAAWNTITLPKAGVWTFWVIQNQFFVPHPMHLHGHDFALLGNGAGTFDPAVHFSTLNFNNPTRRDVTMLPANGWTVIAFKTDNPGAWLMHCHIAWHVGDGLALQFIELPSKMRSTYGETVSDQEFQNNCKAWDKYALTSVYGKYDSGLKRRDAEAAPEPLGWSDEKAYARLHDHLRLRSSMHARRH